MSNIIERIAALHRKLIEDPAYNRYCVATTDDEAVEGELDCDTICAAVMLREAGDAQIRALQLDVICAEIERLIDRPIDWAAREERNREFREACMAYHGIKKLPPPRGAH